VAASLRDLQWRRRRFTIAVAATALVFAMTLVFAGVNTSFHNETRRIVGSFHADRWLVAEGASGPFTTASVIPAAAAERVARVPGVMRADPLVIFHSAVRVGGPMSRPRTWTTSRSNRSFGCYGSWPALAES
jgi:putative ABC transport system permease protein